MKKNLLGLSAVVLAIAFSAFTNVKINKDSKLFYHVGDQYILDDPNGEGLSCQSDDQNPCRILFAVDPGVTSFSENSIPANGTEQGGDGSYQ